MTKTILIVEDFKDTRDLMKFMLNRLGYQVLEAEDGWKAVESVKKQIPDLILMDMAMPSTDGLTATRIIRQFTETSTTPIIGFTASGQFIYEQAIDAGCNELLFKPLDSDKLKSVLDKYLSQWIIHDRGIALKKKQGSVLYNFGKWNYRIDGLCTKMDEDLLKKARESSELTIYRVFRLAKTN